MFIWSFFFWRYMDSAERSKELSINKDWTSFSISPEFFLQIIQSKKNLASFLSSTPKTLQDINLGLLNDEQLRHFKEISSIGEFDIWERDWKFFFTIKWLHDVTDGFIWYTPELIGYGDDFTKAFHDFYTKLIACPDWVVYTNTWYNDFLWDEEKQQFRVCKFTERKKQ